MDSTSISDPICMSFDDAAEVWKVEIDKAFAEMLGYLEMWDLTGADKKKFDEAKERLNYAIARMFELKAAMYEVERIAKHG